METTNKLEPHQDPGVRKRLFSRTRRDPSTGCLVWQGAQTAAGYASLWVRGGNLYGHRLALEIALGRRLEPGELAQHACDTPACLRVGPGHIVLGDNSTNMADAGRKGRIRCFVLPDEDVIELRRLREVEGLTYRQLAERFGISSAFAGHVVRGYRRANVEAA